MVSLIVQEVLHDRTDGVVYVLDTMNNRVQKFDNHGNFLAKWGLSGKGNGQFGDPTGILWIQILID